MKSERKHTETVLEQLLERCSESACALQETKDASPTLWISEPEVQKILHYLKEGVEKPYSMLLDLTAIDERLRKNRTGQPESDFTIVYHLLSCERNEDIRIKVPLKGEKPSCGSIVNIWPSANWYEREAFDLFGILFEGHPDLRRILTDYGFIGHPFRKDFPLSGNVEVRYDPDKGRVIYEPVSIQPRTLVPKVIRRDNRYQDALHGRLPEENTDG